MNVRPQIRTLNYIRTKDARHAEAFDDVVTAIGNLPSFADMDVPSGTVDGANKLFRLANSPNPASSLHLFSTLAGATTLLVQGTDYTLLKNLITFKTAPAVNTALAGSYRY